MKTTQACLALLLASTANAQNIQRINPEGMTQPTAFTHLVKTGNLMFISGQTSVDSEWNIIGKGDMAAQVRQVLKNMKSVLASQGADFSNVVKVTIYTTDADEYQTTGDIRSEYFTDGAPASTLVQIERLARPEFMVEIEAVAIAPD